MSYRVLTPFRGSLKPCTSCDNLGTKKSLGWPLTETLLLKKKTWKTWMANTLSYSMSMNLWKWPFANSMNYGLLSQTYGSAGIKKSLQMVTPGKEWPAVSQSTISPALAKRVSLTINAKRLCYVQLDCVIWKSRSVALSRCRRYVACDVDYDFNSIEESIEPLLKY